MVCLIDHHDFESLLCALIHLLGLSDLLQEILDDYSIEIADIAWGNFEVVDRSDNVEFQFSIGCGLKYPRVDLDLLYTRAVQGTECCYYARLLAGTTGAVDE